MDLATILATFPPDVREEVLLTSEEDVINSLPPALLAEAQQLRQRVMQHYRYTCPSCLGIYPVDPKVLAFLYLHHGRFTTPPLRRTLVIFRLTLH